MNIVLFDDHYRNNFLPLTYTRPIADLRIGILKIAEKFQHYFPSASTLYQTEDYLQNKFKNLKSGECLYLNSRFLPTENYVKQLQNLGPNKALKYKNNVLAYYANPVEDFELSSYNSISVDYDGIYIEDIWDLFAKNHEAILADFALLTRHKTSQDIPEHAYTDKPEQIFIEEGAEIHNATLNASEGPIYIGKNAVLMENTSVRGPFALCDHSTLKMGAKIYTGTTIGPHSKIGGEVSNSLIQGYSNKGHDGFLGNSVIGEWCNLGADTNTSNLKNNYASVKLWSYEANRFKNTNLQFCGLIMGDHSKCGINTMFNTGTVVGVSANIFGSGFPRNFIPSFSWGGSQGFKTYKLDKVFEVADVVMQRRNLNLTDIDRQILQHIFDKSAQFRRD
ncbi:GlmU family protein [Psychroflexus sp. ALD_RP9]|uniref:GlmU family protein n=1 Tax=Psychroflexus sp. ALD_RP9 TaxID=2777186 RepID=UPI001A8D2E33|nr:GlmU family protein [Psychroflexus sp. ALD_RP9]QSS97230.1 GlmU family protein [Psychroflexus sp. ALD_RP9]